MPRTRPFWVDAEGNTRHWTRFDGVYRTSKNEVMLVVVDNTSAQRYDIVRYSAMTPQTGNLVHSMSYRNSKNAFEIMCRMAEQWARDLSRQLHDERVRTRREGALHE